MSAPTGRLISLDQFRGYTVAGMFLVNFLAHFAVCPRILRHTNDYCSYADTIMPQFLFAVGFGFRLTFERRVQREGLTAAYRRVIKRLIGLALLALVVYVAVPTLLNPKPWQEQPAEALRAALKRDWFQTLLHIAVTSLWILPVIRSRTTIRVAYAAASGLLHLALSAWFNFHWVNTSPAGIDGGPLGFLTWTLPAIAGTVACDWATDVPNAMATRRLLLSGITFMVAGWTLSCGTRLYDVHEDREEDEPVRKLASSPVFPPVEAWRERAISSLLAEPPFVPPPGARQRQWNYWMMSQRAGTLSYLTFAAGWSMALFALFLWLCDRLQWKSAVFQTFGTNALAGYVLHDPIGQLVQAFTPRDAPLLPVAVATAVYFTVVWGVLRWMERSGVHWRL
jgi:predicted acyltransferase